MNNNLGQEQKTIDKMIRKNDYHHLIEVRAASVKEEGSEKERHVIEGDPIVFNAKTELFSFKRDWEGGDGKLVRYEEVIAPGALDNAETKNCFLKFNHSESVFPLARVKNGSLKLGISSESVHMRAVLADIPEGESLYKLVSEGLLDRMSFAFTIADKGYEMARVENDTEVVVTRTITKIAELYDVAAVMVPAYEQTSLYARSREDVETYLKEVEAEERRAKEAKALEDAKADALDFIQKSSV